MFVEEHHNARQRDTSPNISSQNFLALVTAAPKMYVGTSKESSWNPPPEWQYTSDTAWGGRSMGGQGNSANSAVGTTSQQQGGSTLVGVGGDEEGEKRYEGFPQDSAFSSVTSGSRYDSSTTGPLGEGERERGRSDTYDSAVTSKESTLRAESKTAGDSTNRAGGSGSSSLDQTSADEFSQWSLEKLREVSKVSLIHVYIFPDVFHATQRYRFHSRRFERECARDG